MCLKSHAREDKIELESLGRPCMKGFCCKITSPGLKKYIDSWVKI